MRSSRKKRIIAIVLCMVLALGGGAPSLLFDSFQADEIGSEDITSAVESETVTDETTETVSETTTPAETTTPETVPADTTADQQTVEQPVAEAAPYQEEVELKQDLHDADGNVYCTVTAKIPAETFAANTADVTMEVSTVDDQATADTIKLLMEKNLAADKQLGSYFLYNVSFKVNGQITEATKPIEITFEQSNFQIGDVKKASTIYYNEANSIAGNVAPEIITIAQRDDKIEELTNAGLSLDTMDNDYDLSQITLNEDGTAQKIMVEGRRSTIYGCYLVEDKPVEVTTSTEETKKDETGITLEDEKAAQTMTFENDDVTVTVTSDKEGVIPTDSKLQVIPILKDEKDTQDQYKEVEEQLNQKAKDEEYDIAGFLAYDISFVDKDGNKVEPNKDLGNVKVVIDYKNETIPEGVDTSDGDSLDVTVMHLEENSKGKVKDVVDMVADETKEAAVETTDSVEVEKVEFTTDSFSAYTITWIHNNQGTEKFNLKLIDSKGNEIGDTQTISTKTLSNSGNDYSIASVAEQLGISTVGNYTISDTAKVEYTIDGVVKTADFTKLVIYKGDACQDFHGKKWKSGTTTIRCKGSFGQKVITQQDTVYFVYDTLTTVDTVDSTTAGITMEMFDYEKAAVLGTGDYTENDKTGNIKYGILSKTIADGDEFPTIAKGTKDGQSISEWFAKGGRQVNNLFLKSVYESEGYYYYSSLDNYARLNDDNTFTVYNQIGTPSNEKEYFYQRGNFMPYNSILSGKYSTNKNLYDEYGNKLAVDDPRYGEALYKTDGTNYFFGMYMHANFAQLRDGQFNGTDMIYEFNGDDDLWIYIDGVLVLDIGGIHDSHSGSINFATGVVTTSDCVRNGTPTDTTKTIKQLFQDAGVSTDDFKGDTFDDYTNHKIQMFYMERGAGASTLKMKVNLPVVPEGSVQVQKSLSNTDKEKYANVQFGFQMYLEDLNEDGSGKGTYSKYTPNDATLRDGTAVTFDEDGTFYLKPTQIATFPDLKVSQKYYVKEVNVKTNEYDKVEVNGTIINPENGEEVYAVESKPATVANQGFLDFTNNCSVANKRELKIVKQMAAGQTSEDSFTFLVKLEGTDGTLTPYSGKYYVRNVTDDNTVDSTEYTTADGKITLKAGQLASITEILSGTDFSVEEIGLNDENYVTPTVRVDNCENGLVTTDGVASGAIQLNKDAIVTVTNKKTSTLDNPFIRIQKTFRGLTNPEAQLPSFSIGIYGDSACADLKATLTLATGNAESKVINSDGSITYTWRVDDLTAGTYYVKEFGEEYNGYVVTTTVNGEVVSDTNDVTEVVTTERLPVIQNDFIVVTPCSDVKFNFQTMNIIAGALTSNKSQGDNGNHYFVWTKEAISSNERIAIVRSIVNAAGKNFNSMTVDNTRFYSNLDTLTNGITLDSRGGIKIAEDGSGLEFDSENQWKMFTYGSYSIKEGINAEVEIFNTYEEETIQLSLKKYGSDYSKELQGAKFSLYKATLEDGQHESLKSTITYNPLDVIESDFSVPMTQNIELRSGYYVLKETKAPTGYLQLVAEIYFKVENRSLTLVNASGEDIGADQDMWKLENSDKLYLISVKNTPLYDLPSTGGIGIYWYIIGGVLLMLVAALILYRNKQYEGVLKR